MSFKRWCCRARSRGRAREVNYGRYCPLGLLLLPSCASPPALLLLPFLPCYWTRFLPCRVIIMLRGAMFTLHTRTAGDGVRSCYSLVATPCFSRLFSLLQNGSQTIGISFTDIIILTRKLLSSYNFHIMFLLYEPDQNLSLGSFLILIHSIG